MILTTADVAEAAMQNAIHANATKGQETTRQPMNDSTNEKPGLDIIGPKGTHAYLHSLRHFMRREKFQMRIHEGAYLDENESNQKSKKRMRDHVDLIRRGFYIETIPLFHQSGPVEIQILSFLIKTPPIQGKFLPQKAKELGIPPGPLYAKLKEGQSVKVIIDGIERKVESQEVLLEGSPGVAIAVIYCPSNDVLTQLEQSEQLAKLQGDSVNGAPTMDVMIHVTPSNIFQGISYQEWIKTFPSFVDHIWMDSIENISDCSRIPVGGTAFRSAALGALTRSIVHDEIYPSPIANLESQIQQSTITGNVRIIKATRMLEYSLIPRTRKGLVYSGTVMTETELKDAKSLAYESGAVAKAAEILDSIEAKASDAITDAELIFTGTGSALPCKHRNVTGIVLRIPNGNSMLLDVGEGTIGQLLRADPQNSDYIGILRSVQAVWISHPHADHHLGLLRLLSEQRSIPSCLPIILMAPPSLFRFLDEYGAVDTSIRDRYIPVDCHDMVAPKLMPPTVLAMMQHRLGITRCLAVPVSHCAHSFAVCFDGTPFGRLSYSGDCRPSTQFSEQAVNTDLLIHEATFEDGMEDEAVLKKHSTVGEALEIGKNMRAKAVVLTHFSQRYPKLPQLKQTEATQGVPIIFAFDFMRITPATLAVAAKLTPALRLLYPEESFNSDRKEERDSMQISAKRILSIPGLFAQKQIL